MLALLAKLMDEVFSGLTVPLYLGRRSYYPDKHLIPHYCQKEYLENLVNFYKLPAEVPDIEKGREVAQRAGYSLLKVKFPSSEISAYEEANTVYVDYFKVSREGEPASAILLMPGLLGKSYGWTLRLARKFAEKKHHSAMVMQLPYQLQRTPKGVKSGELLHSADLVRNILAARQAISDARSLIQALLQKGIVRISVLGVSYSATLSAILAIIEPRLYRAILIMPIGDMADFYFSPSKATAHIRRDFKAVEISETEVRAITTLISPAKFKPAIPPEQITIVIAKYDRLIPPTLTRELAKNWKVTVEEYPAGHISLFLSQRLISDLLKKFL